MGCATLNKYSKSLDENSKIHIKNDFFVDNDICITFEENI